MKRSLIGQFVPGDTAIHRLSPFTKLICFFLLIFATIPTKSLWRYLWLITLAIFLTLLADLSLYSTFGAVLRMRYFFVVIFLMNAFFSTGNNVIWRCGFLTLKSEGIFQGINSISRLILAISFSCILTGTTSPIALTKGIETALSPLKWIGIPVDEAAMSVGL